MPLANSPIFDDVPNDSVDTSRPNPQKPPKQTRILSPVRMVILSLALVVLVLGIIAFMMPSYGAVSGTVRDLDGLPLQADVFVAGVTGLTRTDANGRFVLANIPSGQQMLAVRYDGYDFTFQIDIPNNDSLSIGQIQVDAGP